MLGLNVVTSPRQHSKALGGAVRTLAKTLLLVRQTKRCKMHGILLYPKALCAHSAIVHCTFEQINYVQVLCHVEFALQTSRTKVVSL